MRLSRRAPTDDNGVVRLRVPDRGVQSVPLDTDLSALKQSWKATDAHSNASRELLCSRYDEIGATSP